MNHGTFRHASRLRLDFPRYAARRLRDELRVVQVRAALPDLCLTLNDQVAEADRVASRWTGSGTHAGRLMLPTGPLEPTGRHISFDEIRIDRFAHGRIVESWFIPDRMTLWQQWGLLPGPAAPGQS